MDDAFGFADEIGPAKIVHVYDPKSGLKAVVAIDNVACGPSIGGVRMAPDGSAAEAFRLARAMTLKNAAAGLRHGGGKTVIFGDPKMPLEQKEESVRGFARAITDLKDYIPGPDMGTDERCMAWIWDEIGRSVGLPAEIGGIPLDTIGATGFGLGVCVDVASRYCDLEIEGARVAVQGFGSVGRHAARFLTERGAVLVAASDSHGMIYDPAGLDLEGLIAFKGGGGTFAAYEEAERRSRDAIVGIECDIWIPAARPDVIHADNVDRLKTRLVVEGANIPVTPDAEAALHRAGILCVPDFIANAGGVICAAVEYAGGTESAALRAIEERISANTDAVLKASRDTGELPRAAAEALARRRVLRAMEYRR